MKPSTVAMIVTGVAAFLVLLALGVAAFLVGMNWWQVAVLQAVGGLLWLLGAMYGIANLVRDGYRQTRPPELP